MTRINTKEQNNQAGAHSDTSLQTEEAQILHLKRLLVTLKQHYEKNLNTLNVQLQAEQNQRIALKKELGNSEYQLMEIQKQHENEIKSLQKQQRILKELLKKAQEEALTFSDQLKRLSEQEQTASLQHTSDHLRQEFDTIKNSMIEGMQEFKTLESKYIDVLNEKMTFEYNCKNLQSIADQQTSQIELLEHKIIDYERLQNDKNHLEQQCKQFEEQIEQQASQLTSLQQEATNLEARRFELEKVLMIKENEIKNHLLLNEEQNKEIDQLACLIQDKGQLLEKYEKLQEQSSDLKFQYDQLIDAKTLAEQRFAQLQELLNEEMKAHSFDVGSLQTQLQEMTHSKNLFEEALNQKQIEASQFFKEIEELRMQLLQYDEIGKEKNELQTKYSNLKNEWVELNEHYEELCHFRTRLEQQCEEQAQLISEQEILIKEKENHLQEKEQQIHSLRLDLQLLSSEKDQLKNFLEESEGRLKVSQQHLAKKVKESTLLAERIEEQEINLNDLMLTINQQKNQLMQLQMSIDFYQKEESRLQDQLQEAIKTAEIHAAKWEEKYFKLIDKLQDYENTIRDLKEMEKKHNQMRSMLSNLGSFMGTPYPPMNSTNVQVQDPPLEPAARFTSINSSSLVNDETIRLIEDAHSQEEKFDVFGMRQTVEKFKQNLAHE